MSTLRIKKKWRRCIFCPSAEVSKEHFWPVWMHPLVMAYGGSTHYSETSRSFIKRDGIPVGTPYEVTRPGSTFTKKIRATCAKCNNGWMNQLEAEARPYLTPLIDGLPVSLSAEAVRVIARWVTLKTMVAEYNRPNEDVTPLDERHAFATLRAIPPWFRIQIATHRDHMWSGMFWRHTATLTWSPPPERLITRKNVQLVSFGLGRLFVSVLASHGIEPDKLFDLHPVFFPRILPFAEPWLRWPPPRAISSAEMNLVAESLNTFIREQPRLRWAIHPNAPDPTGNDT